MGRALSEEYDLVLGWLYHPSHLCEPSSEKWACPLYDLRRFWEIAVVYCAGRVVKCQQGSRLQYVVRLLLRSRGLVQGSFSTMQPSEGKPAGSGRGQEMQVVIRG